MFFLNYTEVRRLLTRSKSCRLHLVWIIWPRKNLNVWDLFNSDSWQMWAPFETLLRSVLVETHLRIRYVSLQKKSVLLLISPHGSRLRRSFLQLFISLELLKAETYFPVVTCHFAFSSNSLPSKHLWRNIYSIVTSQQNRSSSLQRLAVVNANVSLGEKQELKSVQTEGNS